MQELSVRAPQKRAYQYGTPYRRNKRRTKAKNHGSHGFLGVVLVGLIFCAATLITLLVLYSNLRLWYYLELGEPLPAANVFAMDSASVAYITDMSSIDPAVPGSHWIHISASGRDRLVDLVIRDTVPPQAQPVETSISIMQQVTPDQLVTGLADAGSVKLHWDAAPKFGAVGDYPVIIRMQDMSGNTSSVTSLVHIRAVVESVTCEAGSAMPPLSDFLADDSLNASFVTDVAALPLDTPGKYPVDIAVGGTTYTSELDVVDTLPPEVAMKAVCLSPGQTAAPEDFISSASDVSALKYSFESEPDFNTIGEQDVGIIISDSGGNTVRQTAMLLISNVAPITVEARETPITLEEFDVSGHASASLVTTFTPNTLGDHLVELLLDGVTNPSVVTVVDTTPPQAQGANIQGYLNYPLTADKLVTGAYDCTGVTCAFAADPDWTKSGQQSVSVVVTDGAGNAITVNSTLTLQADTEAPVLYGVIDRYCYIGQAVAYFDEVFAEDNCDENVTVDVDKSQVNINAAGTYQVTYTATDSAGNSTSLSCKFTFVEERVTDEELNTLADQVLEEITTSDMSIGQKAYEIYKYTKHHIAYTGTSDKTDWRYEAYRGITKAQGDCFTYYATAKCLLERIGAQTMCVERYGGNRTTHHYWLLVNLGTGWYHFDAVRRGEEIECFMRTDASLMADGPNFWSFNHDLYPATPTTPYVME